MKNNDVIKLIIKSSSNNELIEKTEKTIPLGRGYLLKNLEKEILKHKVGDEFKLDLKMKDAYGQRDKELIHMVPGKYFRENNVNAFPGLIVNIDGLMGKIISASPGRVLVDFNHPLAGKDVNYEVKILKEVISTEEKTQAILKNLIPQELKFNIETDNIVINDTIGLPESIKKTIETELKETVLDTDKTIKNIKFISEKW